MYSKIFLIICLIVNTTCNCASIVPNYRPENITKTIMPGRLATFSLFLGSYKAEKVYTPAGSCVIVKATRNQPLQCLTVFHVVDEFIKDSRPEILAIREINNKVEGIVFTITRFSIEQDLALLSSVEPWEGPDFAIKIETSQLPVGTPVYTISSPNKFASVLTTGYISALLYECKTKTSYCYLATADVLFGSSGGGLFSYYGRLAGMIDMIKTFPAPVQGTDKLLLVNIPISYQGIHISGATIKNFLSEEKE